MSSLIMMESLWGNLAMGCTWKGTMPRSFLDSILYICILIDFQCAFSIFKMVLSLVSASIYTMFWSCRVDGFLQLRWWCFLPHLEYFLSCLGPLFPGWRFGQFRSGLYWSRYQQYCWVSSIHRSFDWSCLPRCSQFGSLDGLTTRGLSSKPCLHH